MYLDNKYTKTYYAIIKNAKNVKIKGKTERHHIIPKSFGGSNKKENLVHLTHREHFIAHLLLTKMTTGEYKSKMSYALILIMSNKNIKTSSRAYAMAKKNMSEFTTEKNKRQWANPEFRKNMMDKIEIWKNDEAVFLKKSISSKAAWEDENRRKEYGDKVRALRKDPAYIEKQRILTSTPEYIENHRKKVKANWQNPEYIEKQRIARTNQEYLDKREEKQSHIWFVMHPIETNGEFIKIKNLTKFCRENGLSQGNMYTVYNGKKPNTKDWVCRKSDENGDIINFDYVKPIKEIKEI